MTAQRRRPSTPKARTKRPTHSKKKQRALTVQNPFLLRSPIVRNKKRRRSRKATIGIWSVLFTIVTVVAYIVVGLVAAVVTGLITGVAGAIAAARAEPSQPKRRGTPDEQDTPPGGDGKPKTSKPPPHGSVVCSAPLSRGKGTCSRLTTPGQNCGIPSHPPPPAEQQRTA